MLSNIQIENMSHALGLNYKKIPFRNRYNCDLDENWEDLIKKNFAKKTESPDCAGKFMYYVSYAGLAYIQANPDIFNIDRRMLKMEPYKIFRKYVY